MKPRALVFDLDGTLVDSLGDIAHHLDDALAERGLPTYDTAQIGQWVGEGTDKLVARAVARPELRDEVAAAYRARYRAHPVVTTHVYPGLPAVLDGLAGTPLAVLSNKPHDLTCTIAQRLLHRWSFAIIAGEREGWARKPDPTGLLSIIAQLGFTPADAVMIGDSEIDVATAKAARVPSIAVTWGFRPRERLTGADALADTPAQLAQLLAT
jgi:phosphoglycolate phosphatase